MQKKTDLNSLIGLLLISGLVIWYIHLNSPNSTQNEIPNVNDSSTVQINKKKSIQTTDKKTTTNLLSLSVDSMLNPKQITTLENNKLKLEIQNLGGWFSNVFLKEFKSYSDYKQKKDGVLEMIKDGSASLSIQFHSIDGTLHETKDMIFSPIVEDSNGQKVIRMILNFGQGKYIEYAYSLSPENYMLDLNVSSQGMKNIWKTNNSVYLIWKTKSLHREKSRSIEELNNEFYYTYEGKRVTYQANDDNFEEKEVSWIGARQHFFTSTLLTNKQFEKVNMSIRPLTDDSSYIKQFETKALLELQNGEISYNLSWYYGPVDYNILKSYDKKLEEQVQFGWTIFRAVNIYFTRHIFEFLHSIGLGYGWVIFFITIAIKIVLSPITYRQYMQSAKMRVLRPKLNELNERLKNVDPMKKQQETMKFYRTVGVNPLSGCIPALIQLPILYAMFRFFPSVIELRQKSFLWAEDLSSFDSIFQLPFSIPFYGDNISLFTLLMAVSLYFYTQISGTQMPQSSQPGMPNMKFMLYLMPFMMIFFFNQYASSLTYYYFTANFTTIILVLIIKKYVIDEEKILAKLEAYKAKPKKQSRFRKKIDEIMTQAQQKQEEAKKRNRKK